MATRKLRAWPASSVLPNAIGQTRVEDDVWVKLELCKGTFRGHG